MIQYHNFWYKGWFCELYHTYHTILHHMMLLYHILKWYTISDYIIQYRTTWYGTILYSTISCYMIQCNIISYSTICCFMWYNTLGALFFFVRATGSNSIKKEQDGATHVLLNDFLLLFKDNRVSFVIYTNFIGTFCLVF